MTFTHECPSCGELTDFHHDEYDGVADGSTVCLPCQFEIAINGWIAELVLPTGSARRGDGNDRTRERRRA